jgi:hypothetical protein
MHFLQNDENLQKEATGKIKQIGNRSRRGIKDPAAEFIEFDETVPDNKIEFAKMKKIYKAIMEILVSRISSACKFIDKQVFKTDPKTITGNIAYNNYQTMSFSTI